MRHLREDELELFRKSEVELLNTMTRTLTKMGYNKLISTQQFVYAHGKLPVMLVAHLDTVHNNPPRTILYDREQGLLWSPQGLGADDRAGVIGILELIERGYKPHVLFTTGEERGCIGANAATRNKQASSWASAVKFIVELDRKNGNDAVFYNCDNQKFIDYITGYGFKEDYGSFSDISALCPDWGIAGVNLSCGYYAQHTSSEYLSLPELWQTLSRIEQMFNNLPQKRFKYVSKKAAYTFGQTKYDYYDRDYTYGSYYNYKTLKNNKPWYEQETKGTSLLTTKQALQKETTKASSTTPDFIVWTKISPEEYANFYGGTAEEWLETLREIKEHLQDTAKHAVEIAVEGHLQNNPGKFVDYWF